MWGILAILATLALAEVYHVSDRWVLDEANQRYKMRCVNWAGHMETNIPEGLQHQSVDYIASFIANAGFNCVRLTYSIDMALDPDMPVLDSFNAAATSTGLGQGLIALYPQVVQNNPFVATASRIDVFSAVIRALAKHDLNVVLDNHVSKAQWCCDPDDGNGWWDEATGYTALTSRYFNTRNWLKGLGAMAKYAKAFDNVIGMSLRNELRSLPPQDLNGHADWYHFVTEGATKIHTTNPDLLIMVSGVDGDLYLDFLRYNPLDRSSFDNKIVWEYHIYSYSPSYAPALDCNAFKYQMGFAAGYLLTQNQPFTGPLWVSEFGFGMTGGPHNGLSDRDSAYLTCLSSWLAQNDAEWAVWALQGDYYVRQGKLSSDESYGVMNHNWSDFRNPNFKSLFNPAMWTVSQGPSSSKARASWL